VYSSLEPDKTVHFTTPLSAHSLAIGGGATGNPSGCWFPPETGIGAGCKVARSLNERAAQGVTHSSVLREKDLRLYLLDSIEVCRVLLGSKSGMSLNETVETAGTAGTAGTVDDNIRKKRVSFCLELDETCVPYREKGKKKTCRKVWQVAKSVNTCVCEELNVTLVLKCVDDLDRIISRKV